MEELIQLGDSQTSPFIIPLTLSLLPHTKKNTTSTPPLPIPRRRHVMAAAPDTHVPKLAQVAPQTPLLTHPIRQQLPGLPEPHSHPLPLCMGVSASTRRAHPYTQPHPLHLGGSSVQHCSARLATADQAGARRIASAIGVVD
ncbi:hypothetical protein HPB48_011687 [Haemaphysalis longicornis]|uniref:Uncharacterized protein n=1 Tax=Haemaphysalis longicornis TaxID=44386 RepID=A0A9J6H5Q2_HAELO|nr:hypothetical protein HPB48_011687 [Haemaphysalis longicornis]